MILILIILTLTSFIGFYSIGFGFNKRLKLKLNTFLYIPVGIIVYLGLIQFIYYFTVYFQVPSGIYFILIGLIFIVLSSLHIIGSIKSLLKLKMIIGLSISLMYVFLLVVVSSNRTLGQNSFDTYHYLSMALQLAYSQTFSYVDYGTGLSIDTIMRTYDYQSFYSFSALLILVFDKLMGFFSDSTYGLFTQAYFWITSALFYLLEITTVLGLVFSLKIKNHGVKVFLFILLLAYFPFIYFNSVFAFFGNTYRPFIVALLMFEWYQYFVNEKHEIGNLVLMMFTSSALISVSSSGFPLGIIIITSAFILIFHLIKNSDVILETIIWLTIPSSLFVLFYQGSNNRLLFLMILIGLLIFYSFLLFMYYKKFTQREKFIHNIAHIMKIMIPGIVIVIAFYLFFSGYQLTHDFLYDHRAYDMVWYYFNYSNSTYILINFILFISLITFLLRNKSAFILLLLIIIILFINPISSMLVEKYLFSVVYYRSFEIIFNPFTIILFFSFMINQISYVWFRNGILFSIIAWMIPGAISYSQNYYHTSFIPSENYDSILRLYPDEIETLKILKSKIILENYQEAKVISQIESVRVYVPYVVTPISNNSIRSINKYTINNIDDSDKLSGNILELFKIFLNKDYIEQEIFDSKINYSQTCDYLISEKIDFVVVSKEQYFVDEKGEVIPVYFKVRDCATQIYENESYMIYQFYW